MDIVKLVYLSAELQGASKAYEFSRSSMQRLWQQGTTDACTVLRASPWLAPMPKDLGVRVFDGRESARAESQPAHSFAFPQIRDFSHP